MHLPAYHSILDNSIHFQIDLGCPTWGTIKRPVKLNPFIRVILRLLAPWARWMAWDQSTGQIPVGASAVGSGPHYLVHQTPHSSRSKEVASNVAITPPSANFWTCEQPCRLDNAASLARSGLQDRDGTPRLYKTLKLDTQRSKDAFVDLDLYICLQENMSSFTPISASLLIVCFWTQCYSLQLLCTSSHSPPTSVKSHLLDCTNSLNQGCQLLRVFCHDHQ